MSIIYPDCSLARNIASRHDDITLYKEGLERKGPYKYYIRCLCDAPSNYFDRVTGIYTAIELGEIFMESDVCIVYDFITKEKQIIKIPPEREVERKIEQGDEYADILGPVRVGDVCFCCRTCREIFKKADRMSCRCGGILQKCITRKF
jgi:hypothetical protein